MADAGCVPQSRGVRPAVGLPWSLTRVLSWRRVQQHRAVTVIVTLAIAFTVASSFAVTAVMGSMTRGFAQRVAPVELPFDAIVLFYKASDSAAFLQSRTKWENAAVLTVVPWARTDAPRAGLTLVGKDGVTQGELRPVTSSLPGWRYAGPAAVRALPGAGEAVVFTLVASADKGRFLDEIAKLQRSYACTMVTERSGLALAGPASRRAFLPWQFISLGVVTMSAAAISCVLAVAFLGRKRSLGILKVLGSTTMGLRRLFLFETALIGGMGVPLGLLLGAGASVWALGRSGVTVPCFLVSAFFGLTALTFGVILPVRIVRNGSCDQLLNNRPIYAITNPSCAKCGLCGGF